MVLLVLALIINCLVGVSVSQGQNFENNEQLRVGFYANTCPAAENIVRSVVREAAVSDEKTAPVLLRLHFHDCFVEGCDGSILIDTGSSADERTAFGHQGVRGFDLIENAKARLEAACPGVVSCSDIVALAARDAIALANGPFYEVETGRRDGMISDASKAGNMPDVEDSIQLLKAKFQEKGLTSKDLVLLSAAHTIGTTACFFMMSRLYSTNGSDPSINPDFLPELKSICPKGGDINVRLAMDHGSENAFDIQILQNIRRGFAVLRSDAQLYEDSETRALVDSYFGTFASFLGPSFEADFVQAMLKLGRLDVKTGSKGTIRRLCAAFA